LGFFSDLLPAKIIRKTSAVFPKTLRDNLLHIRPSLTLEQRRRLIVNPRYRKLIRFWDNLLKKTKYLSSPLLIIVSEVDTLQYPVFENWSSLGAEISYHILPHTDHFDMVSKGMDQIVTIISDSIKKD
jgi:hypothetical protein